MIWFITGLLIGIVLTMSVVFLCVRSALASRKEPTKEEWKLGL